MEALLPEFRAAHTQVLGVSVDSIFCHANWGQDLGGISFPLLADFNPKGAMARDFGLYLEEAGITDRATVIIDKDGVVRYAASVTPKGQRDIKALAAECAKVDKEHGQGLGDFPQPAGMPSGSVLYVKSNCGFSRKAMLVRDNLHLQDPIKVLNITTDASAREALVKAAGKDQAPCLIHDGKVAQDSDEIVRIMVTAASDIPG